MKFFEACLSPSRAYGCFHRNQLFFALAFIIFGAKITFAQSSSSATQCQVWNAVQNVCLHVRDRTLMSSRVLSLSLTLGCQHHSLTSSHSLAWTVGPTH